MEVYLPGAGWVEFDPTNGIIGTERLIRVAVGREPDQAMPIKGTFTGAADVTVKATVDVQVHALDNALPAPVSAAEPAPHGIPARDQCANHRHLIALTLDAHSPIISCRMR